MKKILTSALVAPLFAAAPIAAFAQSNVTLYGIVDVTAQHATNGPGNHVANKLSDGAFTGSRLGFKGREDLGDGAFAFFSLEMGFDPSVGTFQQATTTADYGQSAAPSGRVFGRESLVGIGSATLGSLSLGRQYTLAHQFSGRFQPNANPNLDTLTVLSTHHVVRQDNMVKYTNKFGPVGVAATVTASEGNGKAWGVGATYTAGPVDMVAYTQRMHNAAGTDERNIYGAGGNYAFTTNLKGYLGYMLRTQEASDRKNKVWTTGVNYYVTGPLLLTAGYTDDRQTAFGTTASGKRSVVFFGPDYFFSKRTDVYALLDQNRVTGGYTLPAFMGTRGRQTELIVGVRHQF